MNQMESQRPAGDEIDALLGTYFKSQMPDPWPSFRRPVVRPASGQSRHAGYRWASVRTHLALAASLAILAVAAWLLPSGLSNLGTRGDKPAIPNNGTASPRDIMPPQFPDAVPPKDKNKDNDIKFPLPDEALPGM